MSTTALARPSEGAPTRSIAVVRRNDALRRKAAREAAQRQADILARPGPSPEEERIIQQFHAWGLPIDGLLPLFGSAQLALPAPEHIAAPPVTELAVSVPLRDLGLPVMKERPVARPTTEWTRRQRFVHRALSVPDRWTGWSVALFGAGGALLLAAETHPWRFVVDAVARMDLGTLIAVAWIGAPLVGLALGFGAVLMAPRRSA